MNLKRQFLRQKDILLKKIREKNAESLSAVLPIVLLVLFLGFTIIPIPSGILLEFVVGSIFVIFGMNLFNIGADMSMSKMGEKIGSSLVKTKKMPLIIICGFILGLIVTVSEPDLQVLASQVSSIPSSILIITVGVGVGVFLVIALLRIILGLPLRILLIICYGLLFVVAFFVPSDFIGVAFDSGGVTTGPMTVPFIMALGVGISSIRNDASADDDSFGLIALCSVGPILAVLILGLIFNTNSVVEVALESDVTNSIELSKLFLHSIPEYMKEMAISLLPILIFFEICQMIFLKIQKETHLKIAIGLFYTYVGLVIFMTGANVGFIRTGNYIGNALASLKVKEIIILIGAFLGYMIVRAEPAVYVLMKQVESITNGKITGKAMLTSLSFGVAASIGIAMCRILYNIPIFYILIPGYLIAIILSFFVPNIFTGIAFDSGGVASGPMTATFLLPLAQGACIALGKSASEGFGVVALVAMTPLIAIQILGLIYQIKLSKSGEATISESILEMYAEYGDNDIIEL